MAGTRAFLQTVVVVASVSTTSPALAQAFPPDAQWSPLARIFATIFDASGDTGNADRDLVSTNESPAMWFSDGAFLYFRLRLDGSPGAVGALNNAAWGCQISSEGDPTDYELMVLLTGDQQLKICQAGGTLTHPGDVASGATTTVAATASNTRVLTDGSLDTFLDFAAGIPALGLGCAQPVRFVCGTNSTKTCVLTTGNSGDIAGIGNVVDPLWSAVASDPVVLGCGPSLLCNPEDGQCVECLVDEDCVAPDVCSPDAHTCGPPAALEPTTLVVDPIGDGVFDAGESVLVAPAWSNPNGASAVDVTGVAANFAGPVTTAYDIDDDLASYGTIAGGGEESCAATADCYLLTLQTPADRSLLHWDASFHETLSTSEQKTWTLHVGGSFVDAPTSLPFYADIEAILHHGVTGGCGVGNYCPLDPLTRAEAAALLLHAAGATPADCTAGSEMFPEDVPESNGFCPWVEEVVTRQIMAGCGPDRFCPELPVTREQMAAFLLVAVLGPGYVPPPAMDCQEATPPYSDVAFDSSFCPWINDLKSRGWTEGCGLTTYCPAGAVSRDVMAALLKRAFDLKLYSP